ncbi:hypothetical protein BGV40_08070 [Methanosarcina sp. Ant1]|nr:hypothetical protein BGV40_08070 [Methanosarcina sp. Ant1]
MHSSLHLVSLHILLLRHPLLQIRQRNALLANALPTNALLANALPTNALLTNALPTNALLINALLQTTQINDLFFFFGTFLRVCPRNIFCFTRMIVIFWTAKPGTNEPGAGQASPCMQ